MADPKPSKEFVVIIAIDVSQQAEYAIKCEYKRLSVRVCWLLASDMQTRKQRIISTCIRFGVEEIHYFADLMQSIVKGLVY